MNLVILRPVLVRNRNHFPGDVVMVDETTGLELTRTGAAKPAPPVVETASRADPPKRTVRRTGQPG